MRVPVGCIHSVKLRTLRPKLLPAKPRGWKPDSQRGSRHERGYDWEWEKRRKRILARDEGLCQPCLKQGRIHPGNEVDHKVSKAQARAMGWTNEQIEADSNLQTIARECHRLKTSSESGGGR